MFNLKKGWFAIFVFVIFFQSVSALVGISPGIQTVDFKPNLKQEFIFDIIGEPQMRFKIEAEGDLAQYAKLSTKTLNGPGTVRITLNFPEKIDAYGPHTIYLSAKQIPTSTQGMAILGNVKGILNVNIPYPDEFASVAITPKDTNAGTPVPIQIKTINLGTLNITAKTTLNIIDPDKRVVASLPLGNRDIESLKTEEVNMQVNTEGYLPGHYIAQAIVNYGKNRQVQDNRSFRLGDLYVDLINHSNDFTKKEVNKINLTFESFWSESLKEVYAKVEIVDHPEIQFETNRVDLEGFGIATVMGFFDTSTILEDTFDAKVTLFYQGKSHDEIIHLKFKGISDYVWYAIALGIAVILAIIVIFIIKRRKDKQDSSQTKKK